jgi:hypothetical protein
MRASYLSSVRKGAKWCRVALRKKVAPCRYNVVCIAASITVTLALHVILIGDDCMLFTLDVCPWRAALSPPL